MLGDKKDQNYSFEKKNRFEIIRKTAKIFEELKKRKIHIQFANRDQQSSVMRVGKDYKIQQGMMVKNGVSPKTRLERCLGHIAFDTPMVSFRDKIMPNMMGKIPSDYLPQAQGILTQLFDAFEDRRTESNYGMLYRGALERFKDARQVDAKAKWTDTGEEEIPIPTDPITALQMSSLDQDKQVANSEFADAKEWMKLVEHTGKRGGIMLTKKFWNEIAEPWFLDMVKQIEEQRSQEQQQKEKSDIEESSNNMQQLFDPEQQQEDPDGEKQDGDGEEDENSQSPQDKQGESEDGEAEGEEKESPDGKPQQDEEAEEEAEGKGGKTAEDMEQEFKDAVDEMSENMANDHFNYQEDEKLDEEDIGDSLEAELNAGEDEINDIEEALSNVKFVPEKDEWSYEDFAGHISVQDGDGGQEVNVNNMVARQLSRTFRKIKGKDDYEVDMYGMEIDIDGYINRRIQGYGDFLKNEKNTTGFDIVIGVDESGSMGGHPIQIVRDMVGTLYKALEMTPQVNLKVVGWQSGGGTIIHEVTNFSEVSNLQAGGGTPLASGTWHCKEVLEKMSGRRKVFFQITDGSPNNERDVPITKEAIKIMRKKGISCFGIFIGSHGAYGATNMKEIFGKESFLTCNTVEEVSHFLTSQLSRKVISHLQRAC